MIIPKHIKPFIQSPDLYNTESILQQLSYQIGLIAPETECKDFEIFHCCTVHRKEMPSAVEQYLAAKPHRWPEMRKIQADFFRALADKVTDYEKDLLALLKLPKIDEVRQSILSGESEQSGTFVYTDAMDAGVKRIFEQWVNDYVGGIPAKGVKQEPEENSSIVGWFMALAYMLGFKKVAQMLISIGGAGAEDVINQILADLNNPYYQAIVRDAGKRIVTRLGKDNLALIRKTLKEMARTGAWPMDVGRFLHKRVGEGQLWYWNRIARSEAVMAAESAFDELARKAGVNFERWSAAGNACPICAALDGKTWRLGEGPKPVSNTHPHCGCRRVPYFNWNGTVQNRWNKPSPYEQAYDPEDIENGFGLL